MSRTKTQLCEYCCSPLHTIHNSSGCMTNGCPNEIYAEEMMEYEEAEEFRMEEYYHMIIADRMERMLQLLPIWSDGNRTVYQAFAQ